MMVLHIYKKKDFRYVTIIEILQSCSHVLQASGQSFVKSQYLLYSLTI